MKVSFFPKCSICIYDMNTDKTVISRKFPCTKRGFKYFAGYKNNE